MIATEWELNNLKSIIYLIRNKINNKVYIGQSKNTFVRRYTKNWFNGIRNKHLEDSILKYGIENFEIQILNYNIPLSELNDYELKYIDLYKSDNREFGYNKRKGGINRDYIFNKTNPKKLNTEKFIEKAIKIHGDKYDYSDVNYVLCNQEVSIFCKRCKKFFFQIAYNHLHGRGCRICAGKHGNKANHKYSKEQFLEKAIKLHKNTYDYSIVNFINCKTKIKIICCRCGRTFEQNPSVHLAGHGCKNCNSKKT